MRLIIPCVFVAGLLSCGDKPPPGTERGPCLDGNQCKDGLECKSSICVAAAPDGVVARPDREGPTDEEQVKELFRRWLDSQNEGDFEKYATSFAREFTGVRRSGSTKRNFDLRGWLKDRQRMFNKPTQVTATDLSFEIHPTYAHITFIQTWASGNYKDKGPKQLVVVPVSGTWLISREDMISSDYERSNPCSSGGDCSGDAEFYANVDWDAYSDDEDGERYISREISRRYRTDIDRCLAHGTSQSGSGKIQGTVVAGGYVRAVSASGFGDAASRCIEQVAENTWLFADPESNAQNDFAPESLKDGKVPFRISIRSDGRVDRTSRTGPKHKTVAVRGVVLAPAMADSTSWDGPPSIVSVAISNKAVSMLELAEPATALTKYFASGIIKKLALPDIEGTAELIVDGVAVDAIVLGLKHDSLTPTWNVARLHGVDITNARVRVTLIDRDALEDDPAGMFEVGPSQLKAAFTEQAIHSIEVRNQTGGQVLLAQFSVY